MNDMSVPVQTTPSQPTAFRSGRKATLALLALIMGSSFFCRMALNSLQQSMQTGLSLTDNEVALVLGTAMALAGVIGGVPVGLLVDRFNRARLLSVFCFLNLVSSLSTAASSGIVMLFASRALVGFSTAAVAITVPSLLADLFPRSQRGRGSMLYGVSQVVGMSVAFAAGSLVVSFFPSAGMWRSGMFVMSAPLLLVFLLSLTLREQPRMEVGLDRLTLVRSGAELWSYRGVFLPLLCGVAAIGVADGATLVWVVPTLSRSFGMSAGYGNSVMGIALLVGGLLGPVVGGFLADKSLNTGGGARAMTVLAALAALSGVLGLFALAPGSLSASLCLTLFLLTGSMIIAVALTLITVLFPNELRGFCTSVLSTAQILLSFGLAPALVSSVAAQIGGPARIGVALAVTCSAASIVCAAAFFVGRRYLRRHPQQIEPIAAGAAFH